MTAQKTERNVRDVPMSMSVLNEDFLKQESITDLRDLSLYSPNVKVDDKGPLPVFSIRGFSTNALNRAFEQPVGLVLDGLFYGTASYFSLSLYDVDRVEVLRGPQGTLFGKNTTVGLFNVATKDPTDQFTGSIGVELGEIDRRRFEVGVGGPIIPGILTFRVAGLLDERDGFIRNTTSGDFPEANERTIVKDRDGIRAKLELPDLAGVRLLFGYERSDISFVGAGSELGIVIPNTAAAYRFWDPNFDSTSGNYVSSVNEPESTSIEADRFFANASYELGAWGLDLVGGYSSLAFHGLLDGDFGPGPMSILEAGEDNRRRRRSFASPLRSSPGLEQLFGFSLGSTNLTAGIFYQNRSFDDGVVRITVDPVVAAQFAAAGSLPPGAALPPLEDFIGTAVPIGDRGTFDTTQGDEVVTVFFDQTSDAIAGYGQMDWELVDRWTLQYGMRLSHEKKAADWDSVIESGTGLLARAALGREPFTQSLGRSELQFIPKVNLRHDLTDDVNVYAGWVRGFRGGGFNEFASTGDPDLLEYEDEQIRSWELGTKIRLLGGAANLNVGLFWMNLEEFQVLTQDPNAITFTVDNAGEARARGMEMDAAWLPTSWLTLVGTLGLNDTEYLEFPFGDCAAGAETTDGDDDARCDLTGEPLTLVPKWTATLTPNVRVPLAWIPGVSATVPCFGPVDLLACLTMEYQDVHFVDEIRDPRVRQSSFFRFNGHIGFGNEAQGWSTRFVAQNFTDAFTVLWKSDVPLVADNFWQIPDLPRLVFGEFRWSF